MNNERSVKTADLKIFQLILIILLISFFEESEYSVLSVTALFAMLLLPIVILLWFVICKQTVTKSDKSIVAVFAVFIFVQVIFVRWGELYTSLTPIYRSLTVLAFILYARKFKLSKGKFQAISALTVVVLILGLCTIFSPNEKGANVLFGNYNTVGVLYFTLGVINLIVYLKMHFKTSFVLFLGCVLMIILSNTRTSLFLLLIALVLWGLFLILPKNMIKPKIIFPVLIILLIAFVWFYYNIKSLSVYSTLNKISKELFNKNFDSGRPDLWHMAVDAVGKNWLSGRGTGVDLEEFYPQVKTPHSVYFDIYLQNGILGLISYLVCIFLVIKRKGKWSRTNLNVLLITVAFAILFYNSVGIVFTKARSGIGLLQWALLALPYADGVKISENEEAASDKLSSSGLQRKEVY